MKNRRSFFYSFTWDCISRRTIGLRKTKQLSIRHIRSYCSIQVYFGLLKEPDIDIPLDDEDNDLAELDNDTSSGSKSKKRKKKEFFSKKNKADPNAPSVSRIPLPELKVIQSTPANPDTEGTG